MMKIRVTKGKPLRALIVSARAAPHTRGVEVVLGQRARTLAGLHTETRLRVRGATPVAMGGDGDRL